MSSGEEQNIECPLCMEPLEMDDINFFPCTCGYQICRFCWHRIRTDENGLCPACRKQYPEDPADFKPLSAEELLRIKSEKKQKDLQRKQKIAENRKHLANVRVVQRNLVFVVGLPSRLAEAEVLKKHDYFGKFGKIHKVVVNHSTSYAGSQGPSASAYVTYYKAEDALRAIQTVNNFHIDGRTLRASLGTTKYCSHFLKNQQCPKPDCMYLHELGDEAASFTKEEMQQGKHQEYEKKLHEQILGISHSSTSRKTASSPTSQVPNSHVSQKETWPSFQGGKGAHKINGLTKSAHAQNEARGGGGGKNEARSSSGNSKRNRHSGANEEERHSRGKGKERKERGDKKGHHGSKGSKHSSNKSHQARPHSPNSQHQMTTAVPPPSSSSCASSTTTAVTSSSPPSSSNSQLGGGGGGGGTSSLLPKQQQNASGGGSCRSGCSSRSDTGSPASSTGTADCSSTDEQGKKRCTTPHQQDKEKAKEQQCPSGNGPANNCAPSSSAAGDSRCSGSPHQRCDSVVATESVSGPRVFGSGVAYPVTGQQNNAAVNHNHTEWLRNSDRSGVIAQETIPPLSNSCTDWQAAFGFDLPHKTQDDDLGFDPWDESSKGLQDLLEKEAVRKPCGMGLKRMGGGVLNPVVSMAAPPPSTTTAYNNLINNSHSAPDLAQFARRVAPPPPGFAPNHTNNPYVNATANRSAFNNDLSGGNKMLPHHFLGVQQPPPPLMNSPHLILNSQPHLTYRDSGGFQTGGVGVPAPPPPITVSNHKDPILSQGMNLVRTKGCEMFVKDWQEEFRALLPNVNISFSSASHQVPQSQKVWNAHHSELASSTVGVSGRNPAILSSGVLSSSSESSGSPPHWMKSLQQLTVDDEPPGFKNSSHHHAGIAAYNSAAATQFPFRATPSALRHPPPGFTAPLAPAFRPSEAQAVADNL